MIQWEGARGADLSAPEIPDVAGTVRAYRSWVFRDGKLVSQNSFFRDSTWDKAEAVAACALGQGHLATMPEGFRKRFLTAHFAPYRANAHPTGIPGTGCRCGLYGTTNPQSGQIASGGVFGVIECWGSVLLGEKNGVIRAQHARIAAVMMSRLYFGRKSVAALSARYPGVPVYRSFRSLMRDYGPRNRRVRWRRAGWMGPVIYLLAINWQMIPLTLHPGTWHAWHNTADLMNSAVLTMLGLAIIWWLRRNA